MDRKKLRVGREWLLPTPTQQGVDTIDTEDDIPIQIEAAEADLTTEGP